MPVIDKILRTDCEMRNWRHHMHQYPEIAFEETNTAKYIADNLRSFQLPVDEGLAKTGIVATLKAGNSERKIGLRADIDALAIQERNDIPYKSKIDGKMHACGHDGHSAMLLGAAKYLSETKHFDGTVYFIFQPAEEVRGGGKKMIEDGLFRKFPAESIYGMHNMPDLPTGQFGVNAGPIMASMDNFEIAITGAECHAARPQEGRDPIVASGQVVGALQTIVSRNINPLSAAVVSLTQIHGGNTWNVMPELVTLRGTVRCFDSEVRRKVHDRIGEIVDGVCRGFEVAGTVRFNPEDPGYPVTRNTPNETEIAARAAAAIVGEGNVDCNAPPRSGSEDFAFMLEEKPGCYIWLGGATADRESKVHTPTYDFNDETLVIGASYWATLVETILKK